MLGLFKREEKKVKQVNDELHNKIEGLVQTCDSLEKITERKEFRNVDKIDKYVSDSINLFKSKSYSVRLKDNDNNYEVLLLKDTVQCGLGMNLRQTVINGSINDILTNKLDVSISYDYDGNLSITPFLNDDMNAPAIMQCINKISSYLADALNMISSIKNKHNNEVDKLVNWKDNK